MHSFDASILSISIPFETSTFLYCSIFVTHENTCIKNVVDNIYHFFSQTDTVTITISRIFRVLSKGKSPSDSNLIYRKSFLYLIKQRYDAISFRFFTIIYHIIHNENPELVLSTKRNHQPINIKTNK